MKEVPELSQGVHKEEILSQISGHLYLSFGSWSIATLAALEFHSLKKVSFQNHSFVLEGEEKSLHMTLFSEGISYSFVFFCLRTRQLEKLLQVEQKVNTPIQLLLSWQEAFTNSREFTQLIVQLDEILVHIEKWNSYQ